MVSKQIVVRCAIIRLVEDVKLVNDGRFKADDELADESRQFAVDSIPIHDAEDE